MILLNYYLQVSRQVIKHLFDTYYIIYSDYIKLKFNQKQIIH